MRRRAMDLLRDDPKRSALAGLLRALGKPEWLDDPRFKDSNARAKNCAALTSEIDRAVAARTSDEWASIFDRHNLVWAPVRTDAEVLDDPQAHAIGAFAAVDHPSIAGCRVVNSPVEFGDALRSRIARRPNSGSIQRKSR